MNTIAQQAGADFVQYDLGFIDFMNFRSNSNIRDKFYESIKKKGWEVDQTAPQKFNFTFFINYEGNVKMLKFRSKIINISPAYSNNFYQLDTIAKKFGKGGVAFVRQVLGVKDFGVKK